MSSHISTIAQYKKNNFFKIMMITVCSVLCVAIIICDILIGTYELTLKEVLYTITHPTDKSVMAYIIVWNIRLLPAITGILAGFALSLAGATMQTILWQHRIH